MMFLNLLAAITAIAISGVAAYYSIVGLTAIFSGVFVPIVIMGGVLEVGKIVTTVWLHSNWNIINALVKWYLSIAVVVLMFITSMGIFGFLSRAHIDATSSVGGNQLLIEQLDQTISVERQRITDSRAILSQMDSAINNILNQSANARTIESQRGGQIATQANTLRNQQKKERDSLNAAIDAANKRIAEISSQKLKLQQEQAKTEAEVGPIKYIAQLIYGDQINKDLLERAVRWVIIIIVAVFDPLAVCLILAVTMSVNNKRKDSDDEGKDITKGSAEGTAGRQDAEGRTEGQEESQGPGTTPEPVIQYVDRPIVEYKTIEVEKIVEVPVEKEVFKTITIEKPVEVIKEVEKIVEVRIEDHERMMELAKEIDNLLGELKNKDQFIGKLRSQIELLEHPEDFTIDNAAFGKTLPKDAPMGTGHLFVRLDPGGLTTHKWNGYEWIQVDKEQNSSYLADDPVLDGMVISLAKGELIWENLNSREQEALEPLLKDDFKIAR